MRRIGRCGRLAVAVVAAVTAQSAIAAAAGDLSLPRKGAVEVEIRNFAYHPALLRIDRGTAVVFVNRDGAAHDARRKGSFSTRLLRPGEAATLRFRQRGEFAYVCSLHPG